MEVTPETMVKPTELLHSPEVVRICPVDGGHMMYEKAIFETTVGDFFVKTSNDELLTDSYQAQRMWEYLIKEKFVYDVIGKHGFEHIPFSNMQNKSLILEAHRPNEGWHWEIPKTNNLASSYTNDILSALKTLETIPATEEISELDSDSSMLRFLIDGWQSIDKAKSEKIREKMFGEVSKLHMRTLPGLDVISRLLLEVNDIRKAMENFVSKTPATVAHFDARQSNIAWHPKHGVRIVDWSWASVGSPKADTTMFLIDLHKSDADVSEHLKDSFDINHALLLAGYWLSRSVEPSPNPKSSVRFHQLASAITAADLIRDVF